MQRFWPMLEDRFVGCLLGLAVGDALGAPFEGQSPAMLAHRYRNARALFDASSTGELQYTDDTQMAIGVAETLIHCGRIVDGELCRRFAANYQSHRGYGGGARLILEAMVSGGDHRHLAAHHFPGGSFGNGAAMRVAPVGLMFRHDHEILWEEARRSALPTHVHPLGVEGAQLLALAVGLASRTEAFARAPFLRILRDRCIAEQYRGPLDRAARLDDVRDLGSFGNGIEATASVVTAIVSFGLWPDSYEEAVGNAILLGGDTDTIAAMAGALSGAYLGAMAIRPELLHRLENGYQGRAYLETLARQLAATRQGISVDQGE